MITENQISNSLIVHKFLMLGNLPHSRFAILLSIVVHIMFTINVTKKGRYGKKSM